MRRPGVIAASLALAGAIAASAAGRDADTVAIRYSPRLGSTYGYEVTISGESLTQVEGQLLVRRRHDMTLHIDETVLESDGDGTMAEVELTAGDLGEQRLLVRLDRAEPGATIDAIEGIPTQLLGELAGRRVPGRDRSAT